MVLVEEGSSFEVIYIWRDTLDDEWSQKRSQMCACVRACGGRVRACVRVCVYVCGGRGGGGW